MYALRVQNVAVTDDTLSVELSDGRAISVPLTWFPRLVRATPQEWAHWRPLPPPLPPCGGEPERGRIGKGQGIHWEDQGERRRAARGEAHPVKSQASFRKWLEQRG